MNEPMFVKGDRIYFRKWSYEAVVTEVVTCLACGKQLVSYLEEGSDAPEQLHAYDLAFNQLLFA